MDQMAKRYLDELTKQLRPLPELDRQDAVREIESHIAESVGAGNPVATVLARLGEPKVLAKAYLADFHLQGAHGLDRAFQRFAFFATTSLMSLIVVPFLGILVATCGFVTVLSPFAFVGRLFGVPGFMVWNDGPMPILMAIPVAVGLTLLGGVCTRGTWRLTQRYFAFVAAGYRKLKAA